MRGKTEFCFYMLVGLGMGMATSAYTMISDLSSTASAPWIIVGVGLSGLFCLIIALSIGELAGMFPSAPGVRTYFKVAFGDRLSLVLVYLYLIFVILIAGLETFVFSQVVLAVFPKSEPVLTVITLIGFVLAVNLIGFQLPRSLQILTTLLAIALIAISGITALLHANTSLAPPSQPCSI